MTVGNLDWRSKARPIITMRLENSILVLIIRYPNNFIADGGAMIYKYVHKTVANGYRTRPLKILVSRSGEC